MLEQRQQQLVWLNCGAGAPGYRLRVPLAWTTETYWDIGMYRAGAADRARVHSRSEGKKRRVYESHGRFSE